MEIEDKYLIQVLQRCIERMLNRKMLTPKDFDSLSEQIFLRLNIMISPTTLKRLWGYINEKSVPRESTLSILSQFLGYRDWKNFAESIEKQEPQSNLILSRKLSSYSLQIGDEVVLNWAPDRLCRIRHQGDCLFSVEESRNSKLLVGDTFRCTIFIEGEPVYMDNLTHGSYQDIVYVAGKKDGIRFEKISASEMSQE